MKTGQCCDGIIFYKYGERIIICLVEMKSDNLGEAEMQIKGTYGHLRELLNDECKFCKNILRQVIWRAYIYRSGGTPKDADDCVKALIKAGFESGNAVVLGNPDITAFLRGETKTWKKKSKPHGR